MEISLSIYLQNKFNPFPYIWIIKFIFFRLNPFDEINLNYDDNGKLCKSPTTNISEKVCEENEVKYKVQQQVFVDHCIMDTTDAALNSQLETKNSQDIFVNKGNIHI